MIRLLCILALLWVIPHQAFAQAKRSDLNLVIAMDCSWSVNSQEYALQAGGIAAAFSDPEILEAIKAGFRGRITVTIVHWSTSGTQLTAVPWQIIETEFDAINFARKAALMERRTVKGGTSISGALRFSQNAFKTVPTFGDRHVIDVIADGENNDGNRVENMRDQVADQGTTINALAVVNEVSYLHHYLRNRVIGGAGAFVESASDYIDFRRAFKKKLLREIKGELVTRRNSLGAEVPG